MKGEKAMLVFLVLLWAVLVGVARLEWGRRMAEFKVANEAAKARTDAALAELEKAVAKVLARIETPARD
jgi:DNA-binding FadR family transcriptional regulator